VLVFEEVPAALDAQFASSQRQAPDYLGLEVEAARQLAVTEGIERVRVLSLDDDSVSMHQDHRPYRLNLLVLRRQVVRAAFF